MFFAFFSLLLLLRRLPEECCTIHDSQLSFSFQFAVCDFVFIFDLSANCSRIYVEYLWNIMSTAQQMLSIAQVYIIYAQTCHTYLSAHTYILTYIADISVHNLRLGILHFLFHFLALLCLLLFLLLFMKSHKYLYATRAVLPRSPRPLSHFLPLPTFEKSICYKFKIIIGQKGNNLWQFIKMNFQHKNSICAHPHGSLKGSTDPGWPLTGAVCLHGWITYVRLYWSVVSTGLAGSGFNVVQRGSMWLAFARGQRGSSAACCSQFYARAATVNPAPHSFLHWHQIVASICCHSGECAQIISSGGCCCLPTYCLPHRSRAQVMTHSCS